MLTTAFPGPNVWYTRNRTVADDCRPDQFADPAPAVFIGACDAAGKEITVPLEDPLDPDNPVRFEADNFYYFDVLFGRDSGGNHFLRVQDGCGLPGRDEVPVKCIALGERQRTTNAGYLEVIGISSTIKIKTPDSCRPGKIRNDKRILTGLPGYSFHSGVIVAASPRLRQNASFGLEGRKL